jgi:DNA-binding LacI/PurR family transcriptional regulator
MAMGVIRALHDHGISVPGQVSVFGWDDMAESKYFIPSLSTVHMDVEALGARSMAELIGRIRGEQATSEALTLAPMELIVRESTGPAPS